MCTKGASMQLRRRDQVIQTEFIPFINVGITCNKDDKKDDKKFLLIPPKLGDLDIPTFAESCQV